MHTCDPIHILFLNILSRLTIRFHAHVIICTVLLGFVEALHRIMGRYTPSSTGYQPHMSRLYTNGKLPYERMKYPLDKCLLWAISTR